MSVCRILTLACLALAGLNSAAVGAVLSRDWKTPGDGLLTYDDVNQREWLDVTVSVSNNFDAMAQELEPGGLFEGFTLAVSEDVWTLADSAGIDASTRDYAVNRDATDSLIRLLGVTWGNVAGRYATLGLLDETRIFLGLVDRVGAVFEVQPGVPSRAGLSIGPSDDRFSRGQSTGLMLYRSAAVPEPSSGIGMALSFWMAWLVRRRAPLASPV